MKATELRIGNYVRQPKDIVSTKQYPGDEFIWSLEDFADLESGGYSIDMVEPIPLTEERLLKFGFKKFNKVFWRHEKYFNFILKEFYLDNKIAGYIFNYGGSVMNRVITEVHWLQNVFILTGEELIIK